MNVKRLGDIALRLSAASRSFHGMLWQAYGSDRQPATRKPDEPPYGSATINRLGGKPDVKIEYVQVGDADIFLSAAKDLAYLMHIAVVAKQIVEHRDEVEMTDPDAFADGNAAIHDLDDVVYRLRAALLGQINT